MKKIIAYLLLAALCLSVVACGNVSETTASETTVKETTEKENVKETSLESESSEKVDATEETKISESDTGTDEIESPDVTVTESLSDESEETETVESAENVESLENTEDVEITDETDTSDIESVDSATETATETETETVTGTETETVTESVTETVTEIETEDPRLSAEYAPVTYFDAKAIYELTKDGIYEDMAQLFYGYDEVTYHKEAGKRPYTRIKSWNDYGNAAEAFISLCTSPMEVAPIFAVKYRTTTPGISMEVYTDSVNNGVTSGNIVRIPVTSDGEWHVEYINLSAIKQFNGATVNYFRFDFMNASQLPKDAYVDFEYVGFFSSDDEVEMFETGKYVPVIFVDENSEYKHNTTITHASSIDMINGAGGIGSGKFDYRGGNSNTGIDKFNHNATTLSGGLLVFSGWTVVDGGIEKFVWSVDGLNWYDVKLHQMGGMGDLSQAHIDATEKYTGAQITDVENSIKGGGYQGNINVDNPEDRAKGLACELLTVAEVGDTVNVRFAAVPKNAPGELCLIAYVKGVTVVSEFEYEEETEPTETFAPDMIEPEDCEEHNVSVYWYPVEGEPNETKLCLNCGAVVESRSVAYYSSFDIIEHNGANISGGYGANKIFDKDGSAIVLRSGYDFVLQGWFACNGGVADYMYSVDGGENWMVCGNSENLADKFKPEHIAAINKVGLGISKYDVKGMYRVNLPLLAFAVEGEETAVDVLFGAKLANNETVILTIASIKNVKIPAAPEAVSEEIKFVKAIDKLVIGGAVVNNPGNAYGGALFTFDASAIEMENTTVNWQGWSGVNGGFNKWVYSVDGGQTWVDVLGSANDIPNSRNDIQGAISSAGFVDAYGKGMLNISADLSKCVGQTVTVIFGGVPASNTEVVLQMVKIDGLTVAGDCPHLSIEWSHVAGENKESATCSACGETLTRDVTFYNNLDRVEGMLNEEAKVVDPADGKNLTAKPEDVIDSRSGKDIVVQGWFAVNGGVQKYVYSVDGGATWLDCGNQPNYAGSKFADSVPHQNAVNVANLGYSALDADVNAIYRVSCDLSSCAGETVDVIFGAVLEENDTAMPLQLLIIKVNVSE